MCTFLLQASQAAKKIADATGKDLIGGLQWHRSLLADVEGTSEPAAPTQVRDVFFFFFGGGGGCPRGRFGAEEQKPKLSQQQLALKWEMQWRPSAAQGTPYSYGASARKFSERVGFCWVLL